MESRDDESLVLLTSYQPLSYTTVHQELANLKEISAAINEEWQQEVSMYEETILQNFGSSASSQAEQVPRRNYRNDDNIVSDTKLYPYHNACYPLLSIYEQDTYFTHSLIPGQLICSDEAISFCVSGLETKAPLYLSVESMHALFLEDEWVNGLENRLKAQEDPTHWLAYEQVDVDFAASHSFGLARFPAEANARADILFKLLRHSISDLQKDHIMASAIIFRMAKWKLFQSVH